MERRGGRGRERMERRGRKGWGLAPWIQGDRRPLFNTGFSRILESHGFFFFKIPGPGKS